MNDARSGDVPSSARFESALWAGRRALLVLSRDLRVIEFEGHAPELYGTSREDAIGTYYVERFVPAETRESILAQLRTIETGAATRFQHALLNSDARLIEARAATSPRGDGAIYVVASAGDTSGDLFSIHALRERNLELEAIFRAIPDLLFRVSPELVIVDYRAGRVDDLYTSPSEFQGRRFSEVLPPAASSAIEAAIREALAGAELTVVEYTLPLPAGEQAFEARMVPIERDVLVLARNVSERRRAEASLRSSEARYRELVETSTDLIWALDGENCWTFLNQNAARAIYGREVAELIGRPLAEVASLEHLAQDLDFLERVKRTDVCLRRETTHRRADGAPVQLSFSAITRRDPSGAIVGTAGTARDITLLRRAEEEKSRLQSRLEAAHRLECLIMLAGGIAHDLNNLLVGILGGAELALLDLNGESPAYSAVELIRTAALRAAELSQHMLAYSGKGRFVVEPVALNRLIEEAVAQFSAERLGGRACVLRLAPDSPSVLVDQEQIRQAVHNLLTNAAEATPSDAGPIEIETGTVTISEAEAAAASGSLESITDGAYAYIDVRDHGCGMSEETQQRMFDPFFTTKFTGRGLGLAAVQGIMRSHRGGVVTDSTIGRGTLIRLLLPRRHELPAKAGNTILIVDPDREDRRRARAILESAGFAVHDVAAVGEARAQLAGESRSVQLVLIDLVAMGPGIGEALAELRQLAPEVSILVCSESSDALTGGHAAVLRAARSVSAGLSFVKKPYPAEALLAAVRQSLPDPASGPLL